jgi:hypothetical protein
MFGRYTIVAYIKNTFLLLLAKVSDKNEHHTFATLWGDLRSHYVCPSFHEKNLATSVGPNQATNSAEFL